MKTFKELQKAWSKGGKKAAANMTPEQRRERAIKAVQKREELRKNKQAC